MENRKRNTWDRDEVEDESRTKQMIAELDSQFKKFTDKVSDILPAANPSEPDGDKIWDWDIPYQELEFQGNPKNSMVELYPTTSCIVHLATKPVCIIDLDRVDVAYYERIQAGNRNFDLVLVIKDFLLPEAKIQEGVTWFRIHSIDVKYYDQVREVLQKSKLPQFEGALPLKWNDVLKTYKKGFDDITADGGWQIILGHDADDEGVSAVPSRICAKAGADCAQQCRRRKMRRKTTRASRQTMMARTTILPRCACCHKSFAAFFRCNLRVLRSLRCTQLALWHGMIASFRR